MSRILAMIVVIVLVFGGMVGCGIKALLGENQRNFLPKRFTDELNEGGVICFPDKSQTVEGNILMK